ncbi:MAG: type VI secretion system protein TssA [Phycisphaerales bacterium]|nr:type VI secretion system protein TssA [Phycisphaerales bacterium]MCI0629491.1 type VI secretion system protein TssA [Phycisphaerales bacterium]MCI0674739.1 type VI secretion system protein TssA [Phycisphaerales bacterium]
MPSAQVLEIKDLLQPIPGGNPAGANLRDDRSPVSIYQAIKASRTQARAAERQALTEDSESSSVKADWRPILEQAPKVIAEKSKDIELAAWLIEALVRQHGFAGMRDGFRLARELAEQFWDQLYPLPNEDGVADRVAALAGLNGVEGEGTLIAAINRVPLAIGKDGRGHTRADYKQAADLEAVTDPDRRSQRLARGAVSMEMLERAALETPAEFFRNVRDDLKQCSEEFDLLCGVMDQRCGRGPDGAPAAPPSSAIRSALAECMDVVLALGKNVFGDDAAGSAEGEARSTDEARPAAGGGAVARQIHNRQEALQSLLRVAQFFKDTEPHSPISYALEQAVRWAKMPLPALLGELIPDQSARESVFKLVGIVPEKGPNS